MSPGPPGAPLHATPPGPPGLALHRKLPHNRCVPWALPLLAFLPWVSGCDDYNPPCLVTPRATPFDEPPSQLRTGDYRLRVGEQGELVSTWLQLRLPGDSGGGALPRPVTAEVATAAATGERRARMSIPIFPDWPDDDRPPQGPGFAWTRDGILLHWTEDTLVADSQDRPVARTQLMLRRVLSDGAAGPVLAPVNLTCDECFTRTSSASLGQFVVVLFVVYPAPAGIAEPGEVHFATWSRASGRTTSGPITWLGPQNPSDTVPHLHTDRDGLLLVAGARVYRVSQTLEAPVGPVEAPVSGNLALQWSADAREVAFVWSVWGMDPPPPTPSPTDVFFQRKSERGRPLGAMTRLGRAEQVLAVAHAASNYGVLVRDGGINYFMLADAEGTRRGGDVLLGPSPRQLELANEERDALLAFGDGNFLHALGSPGRLEVREILCAP